MEWISVKDKVPQIPGEYLVCIKAMRKIDAKVVTFTRVAEFDTTDGGFFNAYLHNANEFCGMLILYWMPLPEPPKD